MKLKKGTLEWIGMILLGMFILNFACIAYERIIAQNDLEPFDFASLVFFGFMTNLFREDILDFIQDYDDEDNDEDDLSDIHIGPPPPGWKKRTPSPTNMDQ